MSQTPETPGARIRKRLTLKPPERESRYDSAATTEENRRHWANADGLSANAANSAEVRRVLRNRSRYEDDNNSYANGLTGDRTNETVGTGPRLQLTLPESYTDPDFERPVPLESADDLSHRVEVKWQEWCESVRLLDKLLILDESETRDGEAFAVKVSNPQLAPGPQLDIRLYEADQISTPYTSLEPNAVDGIVFDDAGNPVEYHLLTCHPGEMSWDGGWSEFQRLPASQVIHWFRARRPGQARGVPAFTSSLPLYSVLRRYTLACLLTAESQSRINAVIEQEHNLSEGEDGTEDEAAGQQIQYAGTHFLTLGTGQTAKAFPQTSPPPNYREFKAEILTESGRAVNAPRNVSNGSSAEYNYSSGRLDQQQWQRAIRIRRKRLEQTVLNNLFRDWVDEALKLRGYLPAGLPPFAEWTWRWRWDGFVSIDPVKDARASSERLSNATSTLDRECGEAGEDWEEVQEQRLREELRETRRRAALGLPPKTAAVVAPPSPTIAEEDGDE